MFADKPQDPDIPDKLIANYRRMAPGMKIAAVDGQNYSDDVLKYISTQAEHSSEPTTFLVQEDGSYRTYQGELPRRTEISPSGAHRRQAQHAGQDHGAARRLVAAGSGQRDAHGNLPAPGGAFRYRAVSLDSAARPAAL
ncbi:MAG: hypothetical protein ACYDAE_18425 [Steroidobacteraceae bacterium]